MKTREARSKLRALLAGERTVQMASVFDPVSSRIAESLGYEAALVGGSLISHAVLGAPDLIILSLTELAEQVHRCARAGSVPLVIDGDHGYGNALSVMRTIEELDSAGAAAVMIEDTLLPRPFGPGDAQSLLSMDESIGKMNAALSARGNSDLIVLGRTSALTIAGVEEAVARFTAFEAAGVDALFIPGIKTRAELDRICAGTRLPLIVGGVPQPVFDADHLESRRVRLWSGGHQVFSAAVNTLYEAMKAVREGTHPSKLGGLAPAAVFDVALGAVGYSDSIRAFMGVQAAGSRPAPG